MQRVLGFIIAIMFVFACSDLSVASDEKGGNKKTRNRVKQITGEVTEVDGATKTLTVKGKKGVVVVALTDSTKVTMDEAVKTFSDVQPGDRVTVKYRESGGKPTAKSIEIKVAAAQSKSAR